MKTVLIAAGVILTLSLGGLTKISTERKAGQKTTQAEVLAQVSTALEKDSELKLKKVSCSSLYGDEAPQSRRCYASLIQPEQISQLLAKGLAPLADTNGWTTDYAVPGAFYQMKADSKMTFGVTVKGIKESLDFEGVKELVGFESYVTLTVASERKP